MDIIPITPAPQPENATNINPSPGTDDKGFGRVLKDTVSQKEDTRDTGTNSDSSSNLKPDNQAKRSDLSEEQQTDLTSEGQTSPTTTEDDNNYNAVYITTVNLTASLEIPNGSAQTTIPKEVSPIPDVIAPDFQKLTTPSPDQNNTRNSVYVPVTPQGQVEIQLSANSSNQDQNTLMLAEIQKLLNQNSDKVTMTANFSNTSSSRELPGYMNSPLLSQVTPEGQTITISTSAASVLTQEVSVHAKNETQQLSSLRQDTVEQFLNAKIGGIENKNETSSGDKDSLQQNSNSGQQATAQQGSTAPNTNMSTIESLNGNPTFSSHFQSSSVTAQTETVSSTQLQSQTQSHLLHENEVITQIVNKFSIHTRLQSGRMSLQLHPAELGELKIDIEMKGDSLKANIVAQTQQAQEIIEKNLPKLRSVLQEQGLTVDDLIVTFQSDTVDDFSQQHDNFFQDQMKQFTKSSRNIKPVDFDQAIEDNPLVDEQEQNGVNLTV